MKTILFISILAVAQCGVFAAENTDQPTPIMEEGFFIDGIEGILQKDKNADSWSFNPSITIKMAKYDYPAGQPIPMLSCSVLEQITRLADGQDTLRIRLWAMATEYKHSNYLYAVFFMPLKETVQKHESEAAAGQLVEPNAPAQPQPESIIPLDILKQLNANSAPDLQKFQKVAEVTGDINLIGRSGFLQKSGQDEFFVPDAFGQNVDQRQFKLLPGAALESAEKEMNKTPGRQRFTVSGLVTNYKGSNYILLRRAERTFTHGNFTQ